MLDDDKLDFLYWQLKEFSSQPIDKTESGWRLRVDVKQQHIDSHVVDFKYFENRGRLAASIAYRGALSRTQALGLMNTPFLTLDVLERNFQVTFERSGLSQIRVDFGDHFDSLGAQVDDSIVLDFRVENKQIVDLIVHVLPSLERDWDWQFKKLREVTPAVERVSPYFFFVESFLKDLLEETRVVKGNPDKDRNSGGVQVSHQAGSETSFGQIRWFWLDAERIHLALPNPTEFGIDEQLLKVEFGLAGFQPNRSGTAWVLNLRGEHVVEAACRKMLYVLRKIFQASPSHYWRFHPAVAAGNLLITARGADWIQYGNAYFEEATAEIRGLVSEGFQLPGPLLAPEWLIPFMVE